MKKGRALLRRFQSSKKTFSSTSSSSSSSLNNQAATPPPPPKHKLEMDDASKRYCYNPTLHWNPQVEDYFVKAYGGDHFSRISKALTQPSCYSCVRVNTLRSTTDAVIEKLLEILQESKLKTNVHDQYTSKIDDDNFSVSQKLETTANGAVSKSNGGSCGKAAFDITKSVDPLNVNLETNPISKCQIPGLDYVLFVKGSGPHPIQYGTDQDKPPKEVILSRKCAEAVLRGAQVYVPGVLACSAHVEEGDVVAVSVAIEQPGSGNGWGVGITRGTILEGLQTDPQYFERDGLYIGQGTTMLSRAGIFRVLSGLALNMTDRVFSLPSFNNVLEGEIFLQNLPSIITAHVLDPQPGERILDMCAAPGGKTTAIATLMKDQGEVIAVDRSHNKVAEIQKLAAELGMKSITTYKLDALKSVRTGESKDIVYASTQVSDIPKFQTEKLSSDTAELSEANNVSDEQAKGVSTQVSDIPKFQTENVSSCPVELSESKNVSDEQVKGVRYASRSEERKKTRRMKNGVGRNHSVGGRVEKCDGFLPNSFDRVLLDAPCSALGLRPRLFAGEETVESMRKHSKYQRRMFDQAVQLVRPGGVLVYSTCTINPGENEGLVRYALDKYKFLSLGSQHPRVGGPGLVGRCESSDGYVEEWLRSGEEDLVQRFDPSSSLDTIGFFIAKFIVGPKDV